MLMGLVVPRQYDGVVAVQRLQVAHSEFHKNAGDVIRRADQGAAVSEEMALGADSDFARTSSEIVATLMTLPIE